jgi:hypothetical protein
MTKIAQLCIGVKCLGTWNVTALTLRLLVLSPSWMVRVELPSGEKDRIATTLGKLASAD